MARVTGGTILAGGFTVKEAIMGKDDIENIAATASPKKRGEHDITEEVIEVVSEKTGYPKLTKRKSTQTWKPRSARLRLWNENTSVRHRFESDHTLHRRGCDA